MNMAAIQCLERALGQVLRQINGASELRYAGRYLARTHTATEY